MEFRRVLFRSLHGIVAHVAVPAEDLDRLFGDSDSRLTGEELGHRALATGEGLVGRAHPTGAPNEQPRGIDTHLHIGQFESDGLILNDRSSELFAFLGVLERVLVGRARAAERLGAHGWSRGFKSSPRVLSPPRRAPAKRS